MTWRDESEARKLWGFRDGRCLGIVTKDELCQTEEFSVLIVDTLLAVVSLSSVLERSPCLECFFCYRLAPDITAFPFQ